MAVSLKRVYDAPSPADGRRILVDRLWPRGVSRAEAHIDRWMKEIAPSAELRRWFGHDPSRWPEFQARYREELARPAAASALADLRALSLKGPVTLLYGAKDAAHNNAVVLKAVLDEA